MRLPSLDRTTISLGDPAGPICLTEDHIDNITFTQREEEKVKMKKKKKKGGGRKRKEEKENQLIHRYSKAPPKKPKVVPPRVPPSQSPPIFPLLIPTEWSVKYSWVGCGACSQQHLPYPVCYPQQLFFRLP